MDFVQSEKCMKVGWFQSDMQQKTNKQKEQWPSPTPATIKLTQKKSPKEIQKKIVKCPENNIVNRSFQRNIFDFRSCKSIISIFSFTSHFFPPEHLYFPVSVFVRVYVCLSKSSKRLEKTGFPLLYHFFS